MAASARLRAGSWVAVCSLALFLGALLLFWVQPLLGKLILPSLGGSPAVWTTCMAFFQTALLAGYAWAFALDRWLTPGRQLTVHIAVLAVGAAMLPIAVTPAASMRPSPSEPALTAIVLLASSIGLPFLGLAATAPLVQRWFARSGHPHAADPYFLYGASNLGSIGALVAFPLVFERLLGSEVQTHLWSAGYLLLALLVAAIGLWAWRAAGRGVSGAAVAASGAPAPGRRRQAAWIVSAAVPASLLLGVTAHIATDIAAAPRAAWRGSASPALHRTGSRSPPAPRRSIAFT